MRGYHPRLTGIVDDAELAWNQAVADFREKEQALNQAERDLMAVADQANASPEDAAEWLRLMNKIQAMQVTLETIHSTLDTAASWWNSFTSHIPGLSGKRQMGAAFIVPIGLGALAAATATMAAIAASIAGFLTYLAMKQDDLAGLSGDVQELRASGATDEQVETYVAERTQSASKAAQNRSNYSLTGDIKQIALWLALAIGAAVILPEVFKRLPGKKT